MKSTKVKNLLPAGYYICQIKQELFVFKQVTSQVTNGKSGGKAAIIVFPKFFKQRPGINQKATLCALKDQKLGVSQGRLIKETRKHERVIVVYQTAFKEEDLADILKGMFWLQVDFRNAKSS